MTLGGLDCELESELDELRKDEVYRELGLSRTGTAQRNVVGAESKYLLLCGNNYLGLAADPRVIAAAIEAAHGAGIGATGSRLISGNHVLLSTFEEEFAHYKGFQAGLLFSSGYLANLGAICALMHQGDLIVSDELNHASIIDACRLSRAKVRIYRHRDVCSLRSHLGDRSTFRRVLIVTDGVFSMDGDIAPLPDLVVAAREYDCILMVDDAHGLGVLGPSGRGTIEHFGLDPSSVDIVVGTLSKSLGTIGGIVCGTATMRRYLINFARAHRFATACSPVTTAAALAALRILVSEGTALCQQLQTLIRAYSDRLSTLGVTHLSSSSAIVPIVLGENHRTWAAAKQLRKEGIFVQAIVPPTVAPGTARLRTTLSLSLTAFDAEEAAEAIGRCVPRMEQSSTLEREPG